MVVTRKRVVIVSEVLVVMMRQKVGGSDGGGVVSQVLVMLMVGCKLLLNHFGHSMQESPLGEKENATVGGGGGKA
jgi:hypothetical protein